MAKIPLRAYLKNIENLIEHGEVDKAIAHAKNILNSFPKHIDTYRLLGKAYLESQRYAEAADILQRVLSVFPDDFVSQVGMSIIREDEGNLDASIWHMERAYEVQPFNPAVQEELRRLYGRRDGIEPHKIRLTRGSLVRMYARGELYAQAIAEIRAALSEDPQRFDLQVILAQMYDQSGLRIEATETCSAILNKLPFCYEANRILAHILPGTSRAEDARIFQQRIVSLNPYEAFVSPTAPTAEQVPEQAVTLEVLSFDEADKVSSTPDWTRNVGVEWQEEPAEELPDWLNTLTPQSQETAADAPTAEEEPPVSSTDETTTGQIGAEDELIPDWMKSAGWQPSTGEAGESLPFEDAEIEEEPSAEDFIGHPGRDSRLAARHGSGRERGGTKG